jgi:hypothetical protein
MSNHNEHFRPLRGGIVIVARTENNFGTLGMVVTKTGVDRWGLTCGHVLGPLAGPVPPADPVFQPDNSATTFRVGETVSTVADPTLDCAAFRIDAGIPISKEILGIGTPAAPKAPATGMRVIKSGRSTEVTEGEIDSVTGARVEIKLRSDYPAAYDLSDPGDSGAVWFEQSTLAPVALHRAGTTSGPSFAFASDITAVLTRLGLSMLP